jgi:hypothetical protein
MRLFTFALLAIISSVPALARDGCGSLLERTQAFWDAGQRGDGAAMAKMFDPGLIFFNETGERATRADLLHRRGGNGAAQPSCNSARLRPGENKTVWKMIASKTLSLLQDLDLVVLDGETLNEYVGSYEDGSTKFTFVHKGQDLLASINDGAETAQKAQSRDIFFTPGHVTTPKVFQRGHDGRITSFIYLRGRSSIVFKRVA